MLRPHLGRLFGIDFSEGMLEKARAKLGEDVELTCGSILEMPYAVESFDGITCNQVIHHLEDGPGAADALTSGLDRIAAVESTLSTWRSDSALSRLNRSAG